MPMNSTAETTPKGPSTRTGNVHSRILGYLAEGFSFLIVLSVFKLDSYSACKNQSAMPGYLKLKCPTINLNNLTSIINMTIPCYFYCNSDFVYQSIIRFGVACNTIFSIGVSCFQWSLGTAARLTLEFQQTPTHYTHTSIVPIGFQTPMIRFAMPLIETLVSVLFY